MAQDVYLSVLFWGMFLEVKLWGAREGVLKRQHGRLNRCARGQESPFHQGLMPAEACLSGRISHTALRSFKQELLFWRLPLF